MKKKTFKLPQTRVIEVKEADLICTSTPAAFSLGDDSTIEQGSDDVWSKDNLDW